MMAPTFQYYIGGIKACKPVGRVGLPKFLEAIEHPKESTSELFKQIKQAEIDDDMPLKATLKCRLPFFTPCIEIEGWRCYDGIVGFTGLLVLDFDHLESPEYSEAFKVAIFNEYPFIIAAWLSPAKHGVKALVSIPVCKSIDEFKDYFRAIQNVFDIYEGFDESSKNPVLPLFLSYDNAMVSRLDYTQWTKKSYLPETAPLVVMDVGVTENEQLIFKIIKANIDTIINTGHVKLRSTSYALGGYVGSGYITEPAALVMINNLIDGNSYLSKKAKTYKKTAETMIRQGQSKPLTIT